MTQNPTDRQSELELLAWNIKSSSHCDALDDYRQGRSLNSVTLTDANSWDTVHGDDAGIASHLGFKDARYVRLEDDRLNDDVGRGIGIAFGTNLPIEQSTALDLDNRQGLGVVLNIGKHGLQIANIYLDDLSEAVRLKQTRALLSNLEPDVPTVLVGDFNSLRPDLSQATTRVRVSDLAVRALARILPASSALGEAVQSMSDNRQVIQLLHAEGYHDADEMLMRPTAPAIAPIFGIDYVLYGAGVSVNAFDVLPRSKMSDHRPIAVSAQV